MSPETQRISPELSLGEFLSTVIAYSGQTLTQTAEFLGTSPPVLHRWIHAVNTPTTEKSAALRMLVETFELSSDEVDTLLANNKFRKATTGLQQVEGVIGDAEAHTAALNILAGYAIRAEQGPPITRAEDGLIRWLIEHTSNTDS